MEITKSLRPGEGGCDFKAMSLDVKRVDLSCLIFMVNWAGSRIKGLKPGIFVDYNSCMNI